MSRRIPVKTRKIIERRLQEAEEVSPREMKAKAKESSKEEIEKPKDMEDRDSDHPHTQFDILFDRIQQKIDRRPAIRRPHMYKALLQSLIVPLATGSNKNKLAVAAKQFLADFNEIQKG